METPRSTDRDLVSRLGVEAVSAYLETASHYSSDWLVARELDAESVLVLNLELRSGAGSEDYREAGRLFLRGDGLGNYFFVDHSDASHAVRLLAHDPPGIEDSGIDIHQFFEEIEPSRNVDDRPKLPPHTLYISRTTNPLRSILDPIELEEWRNVATTIPSVSFQGYRLGLNPFTKEEIRFECPSGALLHAGLQNVFAHLYAGRLCIESSDRDVVATARIIAERLHAYVHGA